MTVTGTLEIDDNSTLEMGNNSYLTVNSGGTVKMLGSDGSNTAAISKRASSTGDYTFTVNSGGKILAEYADIDNIDANGIVIKSGAILGRIADGEQNFSNCTFGNGTAGGSYLKFENDVTATLNDTIENVSFGTGPTYNVIRTSGANNIVFKDAAGMIGSYLYENDDLAVSASTGKLRWIFTNKTYIWDGGPAGTSTDWSVPANWKDMATGIDPSPLLAPQNDINVIINNTATTFPIIDGTSGDAVCMNLTISVGATLDIANNNNLEINGELTNTGTLDVANLSTSTITVMDNWSSTGTFNKGSSTVLLTAPSGTKVLTPDANAFYNLTINDGGGGTTYELDAALDVDNNLLVTSGELDVSSADYTINIGGDFDINAANGVFNSQSGEVIFDGAGAQSVTAGTGNDFDFYEFNKTGSGTISGGGANSYIWIQNSAYIKKQYIAPVSTANILFPLGGPATYTPMSVKFNSATLNADPYLIIDVFDAVHSQMAAATPFAPDAYISRYWQLDENDIVSPNYDLTITYDNGDIAPADEADPFTVQSPATVIVLEFAFKVPEETKKSSFISISVCNVIVPDPVLLNS